MNEEIKIDDILDRLSILDFRKPIEASSNVPVTKSLEEVLEEFPELDFSYYKSPTYFAKKYPMMPDELYEVLAQK